MKEFEIIRDGMTPNKALYQCLIASVADVQGDFAELGVYKGDTFQVLSIMANRHKKRVHAFDSFTGMAPPEIKEDEVYPEGVFDVGGHKDFAKAFPKAIIHPGFIDYTVADINDLTLAFAHVDLDQYIPTAMVLPLIWDRLSSGGVMACHDFRHGQLCRASRAIHEWYDNQDFEYEGLCDMTIWFRKGEAT